MPAVLPPRPQCSSLVGFERPDQSSDAVARESAAFEQIPQSRRPFRLIAVARANPDAQPLQFPPSGVAYREHVESHVLWRWVGTHAPDLVLVAGPDPGFVEALSQNVVVDVGRIPSRRVDASTRFLQSLTERIAFSSAHQEIERRLARSPRALAEELARVYGHQFTEPNYIAAMGARQPAATRRTGRRRGPAGALPQRREGQLRASVAVLARGASAVLRVRAPGPRRSREGAGAARGRQRLHRERRPP